MTTNMLSLSAQHNCISGEVSCLIQVSHAEPSLIRCAQASLDIEMSAALLVSSSRHVPRLQKEVELVAGA